jgi:hypothetical protein
VRRTSLAPGVGLTRKAPLAARTGLVRTTSLQPGTGIARSAELGRSGVPAARSARTTSRRDGRNTDPAPEVVAAVHARAGGCCERCGLSIANGVRGSDYSIHHRDNRGTGGSSNPEINAPSNLLVLCGHGTAGCHGFVHAHPSRSYDNGWLVRMGKTRPSEQPVLIVGDRRVLLANSGIYLSAEAPSGIGV